MFGQDATKKQRARPFRATASRIRGYCETQFPYAPMWDHWRPRSNYSYQVLFQDLRSRMDSRYQVYEHILLGDTPALGNAFGPYADDYNPCPACRWGDDPRKRNNET